MRSLPLAALLLGGIIGGALGASALSAGPAPRLPDLIGDGVAGAGWQGGHHGQRHGMGGHGGMGMPVMRMAREADTDKDRALSQAEIDAFVTEKVRLGDANGDGNLSLDEFQTVWLSIVRPTMVDRFQDLDEDGDGSITAAERADRFGEIVVRFDRNGDGKLSEADMRRGRGGHGDRGDRGARKPAAEAPAPAPAPAN
jgi:Ca2+-binding EF-hand superfamily protein